MVVIIYSHKQILDMQTNNEVKCPEVNDACIKDTDKLDSLEKTNKQNSNKIKQTNEKISINTASLEQLQTLSGIGQAKAKAIVEYREKNGNFTSIDDLLNIKGIGQTILEKIKDQITL